MEKLSDGMEKMLKEEEASEFLKIAPQTLCNWRHMRKGPPYIKLYRSIRYKMHDLIEYINSKRIVP